MDHNRYTDLSISSDLMEFRFTSTGPKGQIKKLVQFKKISPNIYNLAFGNENEDGTIDDEDESNNGDIVRVLATVASTVYIFTEFYPDMGVFFSGSTDQRTKVYKYALARNYLELRKSFFIEGIRILKDGSYIRCPFNTSETYDGFYVYKIPQT